MPSGHFKNTAIIATSRRVFFNYLVHSFDRGKIEFLFDIVTHERT